MVIVVMKEVTQVFTTNIEPHEDGLKSKYNRNISSLNCAGFLYAIKKLIRKNIIAE